MGTKSDEIVTEVIMSSTIRKDFILCAERSESRFEDTKKQKLELP